MKTTTQTQFQQIDGYLSLEEATASLVHVAKCMQSTHTAASFNSNKDIQVRLFDARKASVRVLLSLIEQYIDQIPDE